MPFARARLNALRSWLESNGVQSNDLDRSVRQIDERLLGSDWSEASAEQRFWILASWISLPSSHFKASYENEEMVVGCMLLDESL